MDKKLKKDLIKTLDFLKKVYDQAAKDRNAKEKARKKASQELDKVQDLINRLEAE